MLTQIVTYVEPDHAKRLDKLRGNVPRSSVAARAIRRFIEDAENGRVNVLYLDENENNEIKILKEKRLKNVK